MSKIWTKRKLTAKDKLNAGMGCDPSLPWQFFWVHIHPTSMQNIALFLFIYFNAELVYWQSTNWTTYLYNNRQELIFHFLSLVVEIFGYFMLKLHFYLNFKVISLKYLINVRLIAHTRNSTIVFLNVSYPHHYTWSILEFLWHSKS